MNHDIIIQRIVGGVLSTNCYLVGNTTSNTGVIVDPGAETRDIIRAIDTAGLDITAIILTHGHSDHIAGLFEVQQHTGAPTFIHEADAGMLEGYGHYSSQFGISYRTPRPPNRLLHDGDSIEEIDPAMTVIHTPGHTPGSICLLYGDDILFTGDTLIRRGIGTTLMPGSSRRQLLDSIQTRLMSLSDTLRIYPGHGRDTAIGAERKDNPYLSGPSRW